MIIEVPRGTKDVSISLSGGADSAILLYLLCLHSSILMQGFNIRTLTAVEESNDLNLIAVNDIILFMKSRFPDIKFTRIVKYYVGSHKDAKWNFFKEVMHKYQLYPNYQGVTSNPPIEVMKRIGIFDSRQVNRDNAQRDIYTPFANIDKKGIAKLYEKHHLTKNLLPLTASCTSPINNGPCKRCWWCREKKWAFNIYDYEVYKYTEEELISSIREMP